MNFFKKKKKFAIGIVAIRFTLGTVQFRNDLIISVEGSRQAWESEALKRFPAEDGWQNHNVLITEI
jgi:hypothetical protein